MPRGDRPYWLEYYGPYWKKWYAITGFARYETALKKEHFLRHWWRENPLQWVIRKEDFYYSDMKPPVFRITRHDPPPLSKNSRPWRVEIKRHDSNYWSCLGTYATAERAAQVDWVDSWLPIAEIRLHHKPSGMIEEWIGWAEPCEIPL